MTDRLWATAMGGPFASFRRRQNVRKARAVERATRQSRNSWYAAKSCAIQRARLWGNWERGMFKAGDEVLSVLRDVVRQDVKDYPIDSKPMTRRPSKVESRAENTRVHPGTLSIGWSLKSCRTTSRKTLKTSTPALNIPFSVLPHERA
jgi:hypothetical protein